LELSGLLQTHFRLQLALVAVPQQLLATLHKVALATQVALVEQLLLVRLLLLVALVAVEAQAGE
jgi:hypothetical protein